MDNAVALVQAYLRVNGYFTVAEYPVIEAARFGYRSLTDLDILALRFPGAGRLVPGRHALASRPAAVFAPDPILAAPDDAVDMLVGEVKEGRAELNPASHDPAVLSTVLARFGCCSLEETGPVVDALLRRVLAVDVGLASGDAGQARAIAVRRGFAAVGGRDAATGPNGVGATPLETVAVNTLSSAKKPATKRLCGRW